MLLAFMEISFFQKTLMTFLDKASSVSHTRSCVSHIRSSVVAEFCSNKSALFMTWFGFMGSLNNFFTTCEVASDVGECLGLDISLFY